MKAPLGERDAAYMDLFLENVKDYLPKNDAQGADIPGAAKRARLAFRAVPE